MQEHGVPDLYDFANRLVGPLRLGSTGTGLGTSVAEDLLRFCVNGRKVGSQVFPGS